MSRDVCVAHFESSQQYPLMDVYPPVAIYRTTNTVCLSAKTIRVLLHSAPIPPAEDISNFFEAFLECKGIYGSSQNPVLGIYMGLEAQVAEAYAHVGPLSFYGARIKSEENPTGMSQCYDITRTMKRLYELQGHKPESIIIEFRSEYAQFDSTDTFIEEIVIKHTEPRLQN